jgi:hypothetical protein
MRGVHDGGNGARQRTVGKYPKNFRSSEYATIITIIIISTIIGM